MRKFRPGWRMAGALWIGLWIGLRCGIAAAAGPAATDDPQYCGSCHQRIYQEYSQSVMGTDLKNPIVYQFFTATNAKGEKDGLGFQGVFPGQPGDCAQCHVPKLVLQEHRAGREVDLGQAIRDKADHGISCTYCHSVQHVAVRRGADGRYKTGPVHTVTLDDSGAMRGPRPGVSSPAHPVKVDPFIRTAEFCSQCHLNQEEGHAKTRNEGRGVLAISTYEDWKNLHDSGRIKETCVDCHMPRLPGKQEVALQSPKREGTRAHSFVGAHDPEMLKNSVTLQAQARIEGDTLVVRTTAENVGAGHNIPGSGPIRAVLLKVDVWDEAGRTLSYVGGPDGLLHPLAGMGHPKTGVRGPQHWGGMPGRLYAKPLQTPPDPATGKPRLGVGGFAAERIAFDTTLKYREPDHAEFRFRLPAQVQVAKVQAKMVYRWAFIGLADAKGWKVEDRLMRVVRLDVPRQ